MNKVGLSLSILSLCWFISIDGWAGEFYSNNSNTLGSGNSNTSSSSNSNGSSNSNTSGSDNSNTSGSSNSNTPSSGGSWGSGKFYSNNSNTLSQKPTAQPDSATPPTGSTTPSTGSATPPTGSTTSQSSSCVSQKITTTDSNGNVTTTDVPCNNQPSNGSQGSYGHGTNY